MEVIDLVMVTLMCTIGAGCITTFAMNINKRLSAGEFLGTLLALPTGVFFIVIGLGALIRIMVTAAGVCS